MTTTTQLTPSQTAFKFFDDLFLNPALLADYYEQALTVNGQKNADEVLTQWMAKVGYAGATPGLVYQALQFWQAQGLWFWQGEYNQSFYHPPDNAPVQANQYILKVLPDGNDGFEVTLNGEVLDYTLNVDQGYLVLSWYYADNESIKNSVTFYYSPAFATEVNSDVQYAGNFFSGCLSGNPFKGAFLTSSEEDYSSNTGKFWHSSFYSFHNWVFNGILIGLFASAGIYVYVAYQKNWIPFRQKVQSDKPVVKKFDPDKEAHIKQVIKEQWETDRTNFAKQITEIQRMETELGLPSTDISKEYPNIKKFVSENIDLNSLSDQDSEDFEFNLSQEKAKLDKQYKDVLNDYRSPEGRLKRQQFKESQGAEDFSQFWSELREKHGFRGKKSALKDYKKMNYESARLKGKSAKLKGIKEEENDDEMVSKTPTSLAQEVTSHQVEAEDFQQNPFKPFNASNIEQTEQYVKQEFNDSKQDAEKIKASKEKGGIVADDPEE